MNYRHVTRLPDLMTLQDYNEPTGRKKIRIRISVTDDGIEILGDSMFNVVLEDLFQQLGFLEVEKMLCG